MLQIVKIGQIPQGMTVDATSAFIFGYEIISVIKCLIIKLSKVDPIYIDPIYK